MTCQQGGTKINERIFGSEYSCEEKGTEKENEKGKMLKLQSGNDDTFMKLSGTDY